MKYFSLLFFIIITSSTYTQTVINEYTSQKVELFRSSFEELEGDGGFLDSTIYNQSWNGNDPGELANHHWQHTSNVGGGSTEPMDGDYFWATRSGSRVEDGYSYILSTPWYTGRKLSIDYYLAADINDNTGYYHYKVFQDKKSTVHELLIHNEHSYDGVLSDNEGVSSNHWNQSYNRYSKNTTFSNESSVLDSARFLWHLYVNQSQNEHTGLHLDSVTISSYQRVIEHDNLSNTTNPGGPYRINATRNDTMTWLHDLKLLYSIDNGASYTEVVMNAISSTEFYYDIPGQPFGTEVKYYLQCLNNAGITHVSKASENLDYSFSVVDNGNGYSFNKVQPVNFSEDVDIYTVMAWTDLGDPDAVYTIQYGTDIDFLPGTFTEKTVSVNELYNPVDFIKDAVYYWRVYAVNSLSQDTVWADGGEKWTFEIVPPSIPSVLTAAIGIPANRTIIPENNPYKVVGTVENLAGDTLTVRPGVEVWWDGGNLDIHGLIIIEGTANNRITFQRDPEGGSTGGISLNITSPMLKMTNNFEYQSGPKITYADFYNGGFTDRGWTGAYISHTNSYDYALNAAFGVIDSCILGGGGGAGLNEVVDTLYTPFLVKDSEFTGALNAQKMDSLIIKNCLFEYCSIDARQSYPTYVDNITVNNGSTFFSGGNSEGLRFGTKRRYLKITNSDFLESTNWAIKSFDTLSVDFENILIYDGYGGINVEAGLFANIKNVNVNEVDRQGIFIGYHGTWYDNDRRLDQDGGYRAVRDSLVIDSCTVTQCGADGIVAYSNGDAGYSSITNNILTSNRFLGLFVQGANYNLIKNNTISGNGIGGRFHDVDGLIMRNNEFIGNAPGGGFFMTDAGNGKVVGNTVRYNKNDYTEIQGEPLSNGNFRAGMSFLGATNMMIDSNIVSDNEYKIYLFNNTSGVFGSRGISWYGGHSNGDDNYSSLNKLFSPISVVGGGDVRVHNNTVTNNITYMGTGGSDYLYRGNGKYRFYDGGEFYFIGGGVSVLGTADLLISHNTIVNNSLYLRSKVGDGNDNTWRNRQVRFFPAAITYGQNNDTVTVSNNLIKENSYKYHQSSSYNTKKYHIHAAGISPLNYDTNPYTVIENNTIQENILKDQGSSDDRADLYAVGISYNNGETKKTKIHNNTIKENIMEQHDTGGYEYVYSAGVFLNGHNDSLSFKDNIVVGNLVGSTFDQVYSGGMYTNVSVISSTISQNQGYEVGGIYYSGSVGAIQSCTITLNTATNESGVGAIKFPGIVKNSIVVGNRVLHEGEIIEEATGGIWSGSNTTEFHHNNIYGNSGYDFRNSTDLDIDGTYNWWNSRSEQILINDEIFDGVDNAGDNGLVTYQPFLTFSSDSTPGQIVTYDSLKLFTDNTFQELLGETVKRGRRFFAQLYVEDGNPNSVDQTAIKITNLRNGDFIAPVATETELNSGLFRASAAAGFSTTFVYDSLRSIHGDTLELAPYNFQSMKKYIVVDTTAVEALMGDANEDGAVDVLDVMQIVGYILSTENSLDFYAADVNYDSYINILDIIGVINIIVDGQGARVVEPEIAILDAPEIFKSSDKSMKVPIQISSTTGLSGLQFKINLDADYMQFVDVDLEGMQNGEYHKIITDSSIFVIAYSITGNPLSEKGINIVLSINNDQNESATVTIDNIIGSDFKGNQIGMDIANSKITVMPIPETFMISNAYPNPFNPRTTFNIEMPENGILSSSIYDIRGSLVKKIQDNQPMSAGYHKISWDGKDFKGYNVANGVYFIRFQFEKTSTIKRMLLLK